MSFGDAVRTCFNKYATFDGRASRSEFWWFYLFSVLAIFVIYLLPVVFGWIGAAAGDNVIGTIFGILAVIALILVFVVYLALIIPMLAVGCRRLHDRGQSGWLQLLILVPCGNIVLIIFWIMEGTPGDNVYGPKPVA
jgi:uncharacterized membrane protein YhaH (DUF805 family)